MVNSVYQDSVGLSDNELNVISTFKTSHVERRASLMLVQKKLYEFSNS